MGYTHYVRGLGGLSKENYAKWIKATNDMIRLYNKTAKDDDKIVNCGHDTLNLSDNEVFVNGRDGNGHETLAISSDMDDFEFCKTARKPYDAVVVASFKWADANFPIVKFSSDGDKVDHADGNALLKQYLSL